MSETRTGATLLFPRFPRRLLERLVPLLVGLISLGGMLAGLLLLSLSRPLVATLVAVIVSSSLPR
jgi:hypothetical protein